MKQINYAKEEVPYPSQVSLVPLVEIVWKKRSCGLCACGEFNQDQHPRESEPFPPPHPALIRQQPTISDCSFLLLLAALQTSPLNCISLQQRASFPKSFHLTLFE
mmetsp:Transcript_12941/g.24577  ORF Transcript_12941/g.24577 Transcript_12941/m.24577 type:complete len:105 (-) Transcript_12941:95-409(-)